MKRYKQGAFILGLVTVGSLAVLGLSRIDNNPHEHQVVIRVMPEDATVTIDNAPVRAGRINVKKGLHTFVAKKEGFRSDTIRRNIWDDTSITLLPSPKSPGAKKWADDPEISGLRESLGGEKAAESGSDFYRENPIARILPHFDINGPYTIDMLSATDRPPNGIYILVSNSTPEGRQSALEWIESQGYDLATLDIRFGDTPIPAQEGGL